MEQKQNKIDTHTINLIKIIDINTLVISGGSIKGYLFIGTIKLLFELDIIKKIKYFYGTSFGGILLTCLNLGWNIDEILKFSVNFPIDCIIDCDIDNFINNYGLVPQTNYETIFKQIITYKNFNENITFKELYDQTHKELNLITYSLKDNATVILNHETMPDLMIWQGLYMTAALPVLIPPFEYKNNLYIDGGISENFPIERVKPENKYKTIGISTGRYKTNWNKLKENMINKDILNYLEYSLELIKILFTKPKLYDIHNCIRLNLIDDNSIFNSIDFAIPTCEKQKIINHGYNQSLEQLFDVLNCIHKKQIDQYKSINQNICKFSKYNEI